ncbi:hypothetical protein AB0D04_01185 [Streptomyces sp. NPDC048483]|uniref:hypothetical protein n=1 Tax=Streptomyces sp. NPDC048483 TaxID=3154927 RepID=UPI00342CBAC3
MADTDVITDALRKESRVWDRNAEELSGIAGSVEGLNLSHLQAGLFQVLCFAYQDAVAQVADRCREGNQRMSQIADALVKNANAYDNNEADTTESVEGTY